MRSDGESADTKRLRFICAQLRKHGLILIRQTDRKPTTLRKLRALIDKGMRLDKERKAE